MVTVLTAEEAAAVVAFRRHTLLPLDDCLYALQPLIPHLTRSALHHCLQRRSAFPALPEVDGLRRHHDPDQFELVLEDLETALAVIPTPG